jgi:glycosyltransferase involved in cell wall biosynthesis
MRVAILVKEFPPEQIGGTETQTRRMARELTRAGHDVTVYTKDYPEATPASAYEFDLVRVPTLHYSPFVSTLTFVVSALLSLLRDAGQYDVLQCMMIYPNGFVGYLVNRLRGLPYFAWIRGKDYYAMKETGWKRWQIQRVLDDALVLVQSREIAADVRSEFAAQDPSLRILGNGVSIPETTAAGSELLFVGRLEPMKGLDVLIAALDRIEADVVCRLVGDGSLREDLEDAAAAVDADVRFEGFVEPAAVDEYYQNAGVFVLPSTGEEGLPNAVIEAMSHGLPVVAADSGGVGTLVRNGETGMLVPQDDPESLAASLGSLLDDADRRRELGSRARTFVVDNYSWETIVAELDAVYETVTGNDDETA